MNENLKNYQVDPDPKLWKNISKATRKPLIRSQIVSGIIGAALVATAITAVVLWPTTPNTENSTQPTATMAMAQPQETNVEQIEASATAIEKQEITPSATKAEAAKEIPLVQMAEQHRAKESETAPAVVATPEPIKAEPKVSHEAAQATAKPEVRTVSQPKPEVAAETAPATKPATQPQAKAAMPSNADTILWVPNIFAPASDNSEMQTFRARLNKPDNSISNFRMTIFNRGGHQVFSSMDLNNSWDGTYKGSQLPQGAYVYVIYFTDKDGFRHQRKGSVVLVR